MNISEIPLHKILFLDIETVPESRFYNTLPEKIQLLWAKKAEQLWKYNPGKEEEFSPEKIYERAGIYAEFGKIICISFAHCRNGEVRVSSFSGEEKKILADFAQLLNKHFPPEKYVLCAHNGKEFDFPYIARRMIVNDIKIPEILRLQNKKPWEIPHIDTLDLWKFGDYKHYTSLELLAAIFDIPTPKDDMDGSKVAQVYWEDDDLQRIVSYCEKDVRTLVEIYKKMAQING